MKILLTGCAGFIGSHVLDRLLADGHTVVGVDNFDPFYPRSLKAANLAAHMNDDLGGANRLRASYAGQEVERCEPSSRELRRSRGAKVADSPSDLPTFPPSNLPTSKGSFELVEADLADETTYTKLKFLMGNEPFDAVIHLAAKAGVRPSIEDPVGYQRANVIATQNLLEFAREEGIRQFVFASSSSVYGVNPRVPWREDDHVLQPISPYASTKVSGELLGHVYSHLYGIRFLALRFFTVFGPRQRPDLAINKFVRLIEAGEPIPVFGDGSTRRDYTYVGDVVDGIVAAVERSIAAGPPVPSTGNRELETGKPPVLQSSTCPPKLAEHRRKSEGGELGKLETGKPPVLRSSKSEGGKTEQPGSGTLPPYAVVNIGNNRTVSLEEMIATIEAVVGKKAIIDRQPQQPGDVPQTWADVSKAGKLFGYQPKTSFREGIEKFVAWQHTQTDLLP